MASDADVANSMIQQYQGGGTANAAPTPGGGPTSQTYWAGTSTSKAANKTYTVYMGKEAAANALSSITGADNNTLPDYAKVGEKNQTMTESQAIASFHTWDAEKLKSWGQLLVEKGLLASDKLTYPKLQAEWTSAVQNAAQAYTVGGQMVTPYDMVDLMGTVNGTNGAHGLSSGALKPGTTRSSETDRVVDHVSDEEATSIVNNAFEQAVGRAPSDTERAEFANRLHTAIQNNPTTTKITASMDPQGNVTRNESSTGGFGSGGVTGFANSMAQQDAQADPEYGAYQASTFYYNALLNAIKSPT